METGEYDSVRIWLEDYLDFLQESASLWSV